MEIFAMWLDQDGDLFNMMPKYGYSSLISKIAS